MTRTTKTSKLFAMLLFAIFLLAACGGNEPAPATDAAANPPTTQAEVAAPAPTEPPAETDPTPAPNTPAAEPNPTALPTESAAAAKPNSGSVELPSDAKAAIMQALRAQLTAGPYRTTTTITTEGNAQPMTIIGMVIPPDRMQVIRDMDDFASEIIFIDDTMWTRQDKGEWTKSDNSAGAVVADESMIADTELTITDAILIGPETVDGVDAWLYEYTSDQSKSAIMPMQSMAQIKLWIDAATGLIIRQEIEGSSSGTQSLTVQLVEYDPSISIEPPVQ